MNNSGANDLTRPVSYHVPLFILHWNCPEECLRTINAFRAQGVPLKIQVIDNHSKPEALRTLTDRLPPEVQLITLSENNGWGAAFNIVLQDWLATPGRELCFLSEHDAIPAESSIELILRGWTKTTCLGISSIQVPAGIASCAET